MLDRAKRRALGAFYTSDALARRIARRARELWAGGRPEASDPRGLAGERVVGHVLPGGRPLILDPACGDGAFLLEPGGIRVGIDISPEALRAARARLGPDVELIRGDGLDPGVLEPRRFDLVLGNPPFGLPRDDARHWGLPVGRTDSYAAFLAMGLSRLAPGGVLAFITADTWLSIRSHRALRELLLAHLVEIERLPAAAFDATVGTCAVFLRREPSDAPLVAREAGGDVHEVPKSSIRAIPGWPIYFGLSSIADIPADGPRAPEAIAPDLAAPVRSVARNGRIVRLVRLGDIARAPHGISTGANARYIRTVPGTPGRYAPLEPGMAMGAERLASLTEAERRDGIDADWRDGTGCYVPFDKGAPAAAAEGWLPNYHVPCPYHVNWASGALADMRRNKGFAWKNWRYFFRPGLTFSVSGVYAPTFRLNAGGAFEAKSSGLFCDALPPELLLAILCSRTARYLFKVFLKHSVDTSGDDVARFPLVLPDEATRARLIDLVSGILASQRADPSYPYQHREQPEIDGLVAASYGLSDGEVAEIDAWFARRYPKLAAGLGSRQYMVRGHGS